MRRRLGQLVALACGRKAPRAIGQRARRDEVEEDEEDEDSAWQRMSAETNEKTTLIHSSGRASTWGITESLSLETIRSGEVAA